MLNPNEFLAQAAALQAVIVDVRTPAEYASGHIPGALNLPLFSNQERVAVGTTYVRVGRDQAVELGLELVGPRLAELTRQAKAIANSRPIFLYCWRGGMRSGSMAWLLKTSGMEVELLRGGYKAYRRDFEWMLEHTPWRLIVLSGMTGSGKTELLQHLALNGHQVLDLEGLASHKGSVFGAFGQGTQPTTEQFINLLHQKFSSFSVDRPIWCEGESMSIGHVFMPQKLYDLMQRSTQIEIRMPVEQRIERLVVEYGDFDHALMIEAFTKIRKRFGNDRSQQAIEAVNQGDIRKAVTMALEYYDKCYKRNSQTPTLTTIEIDSRTFEKSVASLESYAL